MLIANGAIAMFFIAFFVYTFVGRRHIDLLARDFVTAKTQTYADSIVQLADEALKSQVVRELLSDKQLAAFEDEIAEYLTNPPSYIAERTGKRAPAAIDKVNNPLLVTITQWKQKMRDYYNKVLGRLFWDLRIFAGSNLIAAALATWLAYRAKERRSNKIARMSFLLLVAVVYCVYMYVDSFSFFTILFNSYMGWWYPVILLVTFIELYLEYGRVPQRSV